MMNDEIDTGTIARSQHIAERKAQARQVATSPRVRVLPRDETIRKHIVHWPTGIAFPATGSVEWPNDRFTQRRVRDGDVTIEEAEQPQQPQQQKVAAKTKPTGEV
jgi:hypothetical protein